MQGIKDCKYTRTALAGLAFAAVYYFTGYVFWEVLFKGESMAYAHLWRPAEQMGMMQQYMILGSLVMGVAFAYAYCRLYKGIPGEGTHKGWQLGVYLWFIVGAGGSLFWYGVSPISPMLLLACMLDKLVAFLIGGHAVAIVFGDMPEQCAESCSMSKKK